MRNVGPAYKWHWGGVFGDPGHFSYGITAAEGGIVTRPTLALVGEAGPEAIVPLDRSRGAGPTRIDVRFDRRRFVDALDYELTYRGW
jgi:hypothetical protein